MSIQFQHAGWYKTYEEQANEQGMTLGSQAMHYEKARHACNFLVMNGFLTVSQAEDLRKNIERSLMNHLQTMR